MKPIQCSSVVSQILPSPTMEMKLQADKLRQKGDKIFDFGYNFTTLLLTILRVGEMHPLPVPSTMKLEMISAITEDQTHYCPPLGDDSLREALSQDFQNFNLKYSPEQIGVFPGPKPALWTTLFTLLDPKSSKNRVVIWSPTYEAFTTLPPMITGFEAIVLETDEKCLPIVSDLSTLLSSRDDIACIIINSPNNPSGTVYPKEILQEIATLLKNYPDIVVVSDEVYRVLNYDTEYSSIAHFHPERTILVGGISKEVAGTGLRLGFAAGPQDFIKSMGIAGGSVFSCSNLVVQKGFAKFLQSDKDLSERFAIRNQLKEKRDLIVSLFQTLPGFKQMKLTNPGGAFYVFPEISSYFGKKTKSGEVLKDDSSFCMFVLKEAKVVLIPGSTFGRPGYLRISYASSDLSTLQEGLGKFSELLLTLD